MKRAKVKNVYTDDVGDGPRVYVVAEDPDDGSDIVLELDDPRRLPQYSAGTAEPFVGVTDDEVLVVYDSVPGRKMVWVEGRGPAGLTGELFMVPMADDPDAAREALGRFRRPRKTRQPWGIPRKRNTEQLKRRLMR